ncbi:hypothetical protein HN51_006729 [Arachis hypogaea]
MGMQFGAAEMIRMAITRHGREVSCSTGSDQQRSWCDDFVCSAYKDPEGDGRSTVYIYCEELNNLMLEVLKRGPRMKENGVLVSDKTM